MWNRGTNSLSQNLTVLPAPSEREPLACRKLCNLPGSFAAAAKAFTPWGQISPAPGENVAERQKGEQVAANIVSRRMRGTGKQQLAVRPHQSPAVTASPDRGKPSGTANFAVYPVALPPCQGPHPRGRLPPLRGKMSPKVTKGGVWHRAKRDDWGSFSRREPSPSSLRDATSPEGGRFCSAYRQIAKSSPFRGSWHGVSRD